MKILRLVYEWPPPWDGLASGIYELTRAQVERGHDLIVFSGGGFKNLGKEKPDNHNTKEGQTLFRSDRKGFLRVYRFPRALKWFSLFLTTAPAVLLGYLFLKLTGRGPNLVHGHGHITLWFNLYKLLFGWLDKTPYILHLHITAAGREAQTDRAELDFWTKNFEWPLHKFSDWLGVRVANRVICVSSRVMEEATKFYGAKFAKLAVVENGVNTTRFSPRVQNSTRPERVNPPMADQNLLYVGMLSPRKNAHLLVEAMKFLPESFRLTIVGRGAKDYEDKLHWLVFSLELQERVRFEGYVEYPRLPSFYRNAAIFVLPSSYEGLPKVVLEALASGVPVLASGFEIKEKIRGLEFLDGLEPATIAERIQEVLAEGFAVDTDKVREAYSWKTKAKEIEKVYSAVMGC